MIILTIFLLLTTVFFWWRGRHWKGMYKLALSPHVALIMTEFASSWGEGFRDAMRNEWPEEIGNDKTNPDQRIH